jgi:hypothetical protein
VTILGAPGVESLRTTRDDASGLELRERAASRVGALVTFGLPAALLWLAAGEVRLAAPWARAASLALGALALRRALVRASVVADAPARALFVRVGPGKVRAAPRKIPFDAVECLHLGAEAPSKSDPPALVTLSLRDGGRVAFESSAGRRLAARIGCTLAVAPEPGAPLRPRARLPGDDA